MREISQIYAVKLNVLYEKNPIFLQQEIKKDDIVYLFASYWTTQNSICITA